jgi:hypothetical protein
VCIHWCTVQHSIGVRLKLSTHIVELANMAYAVLGWDRHSVVFFTRTLSLSLSLELVSHTRRSRSLAHLARSPLPHSYERENKTAGIQEERLAVALQKTNGVTQDAILIALQQRSSSLE